MKKIPVNDSRLTVGIEKVKPPKGGAKINVRREDGVAYFKVGETKGGVPHEIRVQVVGTDLVFFPERSAAHREILLAMGEAI